jgi:hypothetical protein
LFMFLSPFFVFVYGIITNVMYQTLKMNAKFDLNPL